jgi:hypothetical protein
MRARFFSLTGRTNEAIETYKSGLSNGISPSLSRLESEVSSDIAWCELREGNGAAAQDHAITAERTLNLDIQIDDRAATHSRLSKVYYLLGDSRNAARHDALANASWQQFSSLQDQIVTLLGRMSENGFLL